jgi:hypothetical protein
MRELLHSVKGKGILVCQVQYIFMKMSVIIQNTRYKLILLFPSEQGTTGHPKAVLTSHKVQVNNSYFLGKRINEPNVNVSSTYSYLK